MMTKKKEEKAKFICNKINAFLMLQFSFPFSSLFFFHFPGFNTSYKIILYSGFFIEGPQQHSYTIFIVNRLEYILVSPMPKNERRDEKKIQLK
jgi:hypothetical protein